MEHVEELQDFAGSLDELKAIVDNLISIHGGDKIISTDAGANNVSFRLYDREPSKKRKSRNK